MNKDKILKKIADGKQKPSRACNEKGCPRRVRHDRQFCSLHDGRKKSGKVTLTLKGGALADKIRAKQAARKTRSETKDQKTTDKVGDTKTDGVVVSGLSGFSGPKKDK